MRDAIERSDGLEPDAVLDVLIDAHTTLALDQGAALMLLVRELRYVPDYYQRAAERNDARYTDAWAEVIIKLHPELSLDEAASRRPWSHRPGRIGRPRRLDRPGRQASHHRDLLRHMCRAALAGVR